MTFATGHFLYRRRMMNIAKQHLLGRDEMIAGVREFERSRSDHECRNIWKLTNISSNHQNICLRRTRT